MCYVNAMTPQFALVLSFDGITLLQRHAAGWERVGSVALTESDTLEQELTRLRGLAQERAPGGFTTALVMPDAEVRYTEVAITAADRAGQRAEIRNALEGETPYDLDEIAFDWETSERTARVALVARETLEQAEEIARHHRFNPACFTAAPRASQFPRAPDFGASSTLETLLPEGDALVPDRRVIREGARPDPAPPEADAPATAAHVAPEPARTGASADAAFKAAAPASGASASGGLTARARGWRGWLGGPADADSPGQPPARDHPATPASATRTARGNDKPSEPPAAAPASSPDSTPLRAAATQPEGTQARPSDTDHAAQSEPAPPKTAAAASTTQPGRKTRGRKGASPGTRKPATKPGKRSTGALTGRRRGPASTPTAHPPEPRRLRMAEGAGDGDEPVTVFGAAEAERGRRRRRLALSGGAVLLLAAAVGLWATALWFGETHEQVLVAPPTEAPAAPEAPDFAAMDTSRLGALDTPRIPVDAPPIGALTQSALSRPHIPEPILPALEYALIGGGIAAATPEAAFTRHRFDVVLGPPPLLPASRPTTDAPPDTPPDAAAILAATPEAATRRLPPAVDLVTGAPPVIPDPRTLGTEAPAPPVLDGAGIVAATPPAALERQRVAVEVIIGEPPILPAPRAPDPVAATAPTPVLDGGGLVAVTPESAFERRRPVIEIVTGAPPLTPVSRAPGAVADAPRLDGGGIVAATPDAAFAAIGAPRDASAPARAPIIASDPALADFRPEPRPAAVAASGPDDAVRRDAIAAAIADASEASEPPAPRTRPDSLTEAASEIRAAPEDAFASATENAVATAPRPDGRPQNFAESRAVQRATEAAAQQAAAAQADAPVTGASTPAASAPTPSVPQIPSSALVADAATNSGMLNLRRINLIGVFGGNSDRRALVRMSNGRMVRVGVGDELDGGRVAAIDDSALRYVKRGRDHILRVGGDS